MIKKRSIFIENKQKYNLDALNYSDNNMQNKQKSTLFYYMYMR